METSTDISLNNVVTLVGQKFEYLVGDDKFREEYEIYKIVERGSKKLPDWLSFDRNTSLLVGVPLEKDVGIHNMRMRACMIEKTNTDCQNKISKSFQIDVVEPLRTEAERAIPDRSPILQNPINQLEVHVGKYYEYRIPAGTFNDTEDGDTRNLSLSITLVYGKPLPKRAWIMFNETSQTIYGFPLWQDIIDDKKDRIMTIILTAKDSAGQIEKDAIRLIYNKSHVMGHSHKIDLGFSGNFKDFMKSRNNLINVARDITSFYGDSNLDFLTVLETRSGSLNVVWSNSSLAGEACDRRKIQNLFDKLVDANGTIKEEFEDLFSNSPRNSSLADVNITSAKLEFVGDCLLPVTTAAVPPVVTNSPASSTDDDDKIWIEVVIPALVAILLLVIVALILLICCRHRRSRKKLSKSEKPMFLEDRRPIIFPEELEMTDPNLKPKTPLVLPSDLMSDTPPPVPPHRNRDVPQYQVPAMDDDVFVSDSRSPPPPQLEGSQISDPPPYRLPPPYFNPHRSNR